MPRFSIPAPLGRPGQSRRAIGVAAPAGGMKESEVRRGLRLLVRRGHPVVPAANVFARHGHFAGTDAARLAAFHQLLRFPEVRAVLMTRGGYGCMRLLDKLDWNLLRRKKPLLAGFSDLTALFYAALKKTGLGSLYSPMLLNLGKLRREDERRLWLALEEGLFPPLRFRQRDVLRHGRAEGRLLGGCLTLCARMLGTPYDIPWRGAIVFLEDTHDAPYAVDRDLTQLRLAGKFDGVRAVVFGAMTPDPYDRKNSLTFRKVYEELLGDMGMPLVMDMPFGHGRRKAALPFGGFARLDTRKGRMEMGWGN